MPLPDGEKAWQKMKGLLDKEDDRRRALPFWFWEYALVVLLLVGTAAGGYWLLNRKTGEPDTGRSADKNTRPSIDVNEKKKRPHLSNDAKGTTERTTTDLGPTERPNHQPATPNGSTIAATNKSTPAEEKSKTGANKIEEITPAVAKKEAAAVRHAIAKKTTPPVRKASLAATTIGFGKEHSRKDNPPAIAITGKTKPPPDGNRVSASNNGETKPARVIPITANSSVKQPATPIMPAATDSLKQLLLKTSVDSSNRKDSASHSKDTTKAAEPLVAGNEAKNKKARKKNGLLFSAGAGLQQAIAFNGQQTSSYNLNGRQNRLSDKIPSVYLRLQKGRWFLQGEFFYNLPQAVEAFSFSQKTAYNVTASEVRTEIFTIQKLYYHQLPVSINYFLLPQWSVGAGGTYNRLAGAVTEQQTSLKNVATGSESVTTRVVPVKGFRDSFLYRSNAGLLLQSDYHWKRFCLGLRYTEGLQSFIKYTRPDGAVLDEKAQSLQVVLRFRIKG